MRWTPGERSSNLEDRRGMRMGGAPALGVGGTLVVLALSVIFKTDFFQLLADVDPGSQSSGQRAEPVNDAREEPQVQFLSFVLDDAQATWAKILPNYRPTRLVLFRDATQSACGFADAASGPFYCPPDQKVYIDLGFYGELRDRFGAPGDFAQAYVLAHEIGHHVQNLLGVSAKVQRAQQLRPGEANALSVRLELQADCYAGVWGHSTKQRQILEQGDVEEGLRAAASVGDDRLQRMTRGMVAPDSFTHGTSAQRASWFKRGLEAGTIQACDTFAQD